MPGKRSAETMNRKKKKRFKVNGAVWPKERLIVFAKNFPTDLASINREVITKVREWRFQMNMQKTEVMFNAKK